MPRKPDDDSPDRDVLTPAGCKTLLLIGDKAYSKLIAQGLPTIHTANSYRHVRSRVLDWLSTEGEQATQEARS